MLSEPSYSQTRLRNEHSVQEHLNSPRTQRRPKLHPASPALLSSRRARRLFVVLAALLGVTLLVALHLYHSALPQPALEVDVDLHIRATPTRAFCSKARPPLVCAHGGDAAAAPSNTAAAFQAAIDGAADCVEVDAARSRDGVLVVLHVRELQQLLAGQRPGAQVGDLTWAELRALRWSPGGEEVMTVEAAVRLTSPHVDLVTLDVKTYTDKAGRDVDEDLIADALVKLVHATGCANCLIWAKSDRVVKRIKTVSPGQKAGYIVMNETEAARRDGMHEPLRLMEPEVVGIHHGMVDDQMLRLLHGGGKKMYTWTINSAELMHRVLDVGVDALVTNFPKMAIRAIEARSAKCGDVMLAAGSGVIADYGGL